MAKQKRRTASLCSLERVVRPAPTERTAQTGDGPPAGEGGRCRREGVSARGRHQPARRPAESARRGRSLARREAEKARKDAKHARGQAKKARKDAKHARKEGLPARKDARNARGKQSAAAGKVVSGPNM